MFQNNFPNSFKKAPLNNRIMFKQLLILALFAVAFATKKTESVKYVVVEKEAKTPAPPVAPTTPPPPPPPACDKCGDNCCKENEKCRGLIFKRCRGGILRDIFNRGLSLITDIAGAASSVADIIDVFN